MLCSIRQHPAAPDDAAAHRALESLVGRTVPYRLQGRDIRIWASADVGIAETPDLTVAVRGTARREDETGAAIPVTACSLAIDWQRHGVSAVDDILGDFAYVIVDHRRNSVHLGVDPFGSTSLFMCHVPQGLTVCTEPLPLLKAVASQTVRRQSLSDVFALRVMIGWHTLWDSVMQVPAGQAITIWEDGRIEKRRSWRFQFSAEKSGHTIEESAQVVLSGLRQRLQNIRDRRRRLINSCGTRAGDFPEM
jgi:Glutamine amidotransferase domain